MENKNWVKIDYSVIPKKTFDSYGAKPFEIMELKMRNDKGEVWRNINFYDAKKEAEKLGYRLPSIQEMLVLLNYYKKEKGNNVSFNDRDFLGIKELSYGECVCYEWIDDDNIVFLRGGRWGNGADAGAFTLGMSNSPGDSGNSVGFRCVRGV